MLNIRRSRIAANPAACRVLVILLAVSWLGCADLSLHAKTKSAPGMGAVATMTPMGPGHVFETAEEAAIDALAYCYLETRRVVTSKRRERGGAIYRQEGGFTYDSPVIAEGRLRYRLRPMDVAHFRHQPNRSTFGVSNALRSLSKDVRGFVDRRDPLMRPYFTLTPDRFVRVYAGAESGERTLARVESRTPRSSTQLEWRAATTLASASTGVRIQGVAQQPTTGAMPRH